MLKDQTINIRIAGVDAPEMAHFGKIAQPFSNEAHNWLRSYILYHKVYIRPFSVDRYNRAVSEVYIRKWFILRNVGFEMVRAGWADVYDQAGAQYGGAGHEKQLRQLLTQAKLKSRGMWSKGDVVTPSEYKKKLRVSEYQK
jgi:endonuclease YncB( thermonuclease family)